ncbi:hydantoinase B/oxoprolinase family protein [Pigmentiphaga sp. H8]|uniref:hydantoinase B/oxoprolinase family protein n=1 Tax=Pigmentiphaga sp. H8 TaxID=2488560 RepID=UPI000F5A3AB5|nr:hydantoinase B/oxoprolinase family protein [Pigmentiphaga sp. H8]AZG10188.1 hydantoinase B/oxoprolinase family protein [Pigmentiphaga sp. H8]
MAVQPVDPVTLAVVRARLAAIVDETVEVMARTAFSPILNQSRDFSASIFDADGELLTQAERLPIHLGALRFALMAARERFGDQLANGDVVLLNDPYHGGSHLPDMTLCLPVVIEGRVAFWVVNRAHQGDIGGISPGGYSPHATEIWHEGLRVPPVRLVRAGFLDEELLDLLCLNSRTPADMRGDLLAQLASVQAGATRLRALADHYGAPCLAVCGKAILAAGEVAMRATISAWPDGIQEGESWLDPIEPGGAAPRIHVRIEVEGNEATVDLRGSSDQVVRFVNSPLANTTAAVNAAFAYVCAGEGRQSGGAMRPIRLLTRPGSLVDPVAPAPVTACTTLTAAPIIEAVLDALSRIVPHQVIAGFARRFRVAIACHDRSGRSVVWHHFANRGAAGAHASGDGWSNLGVVQSPGGTPSPSVERTESVFPLHIEQYALRPDSGGEGMYRGGLGATYIFRYEGMEPGRLTPTGDGVMVPPPGLAGGRPGQSNAVRIVRGGHDLTLQALSGTVSILPGDRIFHESAGGGGFGPPEDRPAALKAHDASCGYTSLKESAE